ncbi:MAG TPA: hypothetical protein DCX07_11100 [Phycisphaerales bacterium]|nr:hypothetical protein [Phycisphaerales bacterium]
MPVIVTATVAATLLATWAIAQPRPDAAPERERPRADQPAPPRPPEAMGQIRMMLGMVEHLKHVCFDPTTAGMIALGALKDDLPRKDDVIAKDLEETLEKTKTLGLRNALHLTLKDIYKKQGETEKAVKHLQAMVAENDAAIQQHMKDRDDDDDDDDKDKERAKDERKRESERRRDKEGDKD